MPNNLSQQGSTGFPGFPGSNGEKGGRVRMSSIFDFNIKLDFFSVLQPDESHFYRTSLVLITNNLKLTSLRTHSYCNVRVIML